MSVPAIGRSGDRAAGQGAAGNQSSGRKTATAAGSHRPGWRQPGAAGPRRAGFRDPWGGMTMKRLLVLLLLCAAPLAVPTLASAHVISLTCSFYEYIGHPETIGSPYLENNKLYVWIRMDRKQSIVKTHMFYRTPHGRLIPTPTYTYTDSVRITPSEYRTNSYSIDRMTGVMDWGYRQCRGCRIQLRKNRYPTTPATDPKVLVLHAPIKGTPQ